MGTPSSWVDLAQGKHLGALMVDGLGSGHALLRAGGPKLEAGIYTRVMGSGAKMLK